MPKAAKGVVGAPDLPSQTLVVDNGGFTVKAGFAPQEEESDEKSLGRCHIVPNAIVRTRDRKTYVGAQIDTEISQWSEAIFRRPVEHGQIVSWEAQKEIWDHAMFDSNIAPSSLLVKDPAQTTLILGENPTVLPALQKNADEIIMEEWAFGGYLRKNVQSLNAFNDLHPLFESAPKPGSISNLPMECLLIIDSGYSQTTVTPVFQGRPIQRGIRRLELGGRHLTNLLKEVISVRHFDLHQDTKIVNDIKEDVCFFSHDIAGDLDKTWKGNKGRQKPIEAAEAAVAGNQSVNNELRVDYVLPDGLHLLRGFSRPHDPSATAARKRKANTMAPDSEVSMVLGNERFTIPEIIFSPSDIGSKQPGLADVTMQALAVLPHLVQATMLSNILLVGGNAKIPGFVERLESELRMRVKTEWPVRVRKMSDPIKSSWLGGARLASHHRDVVRQFGVTREEYLEHGSGWMARKFLSGAV